MQQTQDTSAIRRWLWSGAALILAMVVIGGITRLTGSGLSMVEWNVISGTLPPLSEAAWAQAFAQYQQFPEFQKLNFTMTLSGFKQIFWWEYTHRLLGRLMGVVFLLPFLYFLLKGYLNGWLFKRLLFILLLGASQGLMGWLMVKSGLVDNPHVSHFRLAAHLCLALSLIGTILWTIADLRPKRAAPLSPSPGLKRASGLVLGAVLGQIVLGAFVAGLKAGFYQNTYPLMNGEFFPSYLKGFLTWRNFLENGSFIQFLHRWVAIVVLLLVVRFWYQSRTTGVSSVIRQNATFLLLTVLVQVGLGIATLVLHVPLWLGVLHQVVAVGLFSLAVWLLHQLSTTAKPASKSSYAEHSAARVLHSV